MVEVGGVLQLYSLEHELPDAGPLQPRQTVLTRRPRAAAHCLPSSQGGLR